jgi:hypothetical protein
MATYSSLPNKLAGAVAGHTTARPPTREPLLLTCAPSRVMAKLGARDRIQAVVLAFESGIA